MDLKSALRETAHEVERTIDELLPPADGPEGRLMEAMRYAVMAGGKRLRPFLVIQGARLFNVSKLSARRVAAVIELVHTYSLVHDDLPAMDDDDLRRGRETVHIAFDEATAILAGDGLLTLAFEGLASEETHSDPAVRAALVVELARAAGAEGMVGGQMIDLSLEKKDSTIAEITRLQRMKTGCLFRFSCEAGAILGKAAPQARHALAAYAHDLGLAFQITDDILDVEGNEAAMGKRVGKDEKAGKATFVSLMGLERARNQAEILADQASKHLELFGEKAELLQTLARYVTERKS